MLTLPQTLTNRDDGSYATGDLFARHPSIPRAWKYAGRADDIIVMVRASELRLDSIAALTLRSRTTARRRILHR